MAFDFLLWPLSSSRISLTISTLLGLYWCFSGKGWLWPLLWCSCSKNPEEATRCDRLQVHLHCSVSPWQLWGELWYIFLLSQKSCHVIIFCTLLGKSLDIVSTWFQEEIHWKGVCYRPTQGNSTQEKSVVFHNSPKPTQEKSNVAHNSPGPTIEPSLSDIENLWPWKDLILLSCFIFIFMDLWYFLFVDRVR